MTFDPNRPNNGQSPGVFPAQNQTNWARLKAIINADHNFLDSPADAQGAHNQVTLIDRSDPSSLLTGTDSILYGKTASDTVSELWFYDGATPRQNNWREASGSVVIGTSYTNVLSLPANAFGTIQMWNTTGAFIINQSGRFVTDGSVCYGYADPYLESSTDSLTSFLAFANNSDTSGLNLRAKARVTSSFTWQYRIYYRLK